MPDDTQEEFIVYEEYEIVYHVFELYLPFMTDRPGAASGMDNSPRCFGGGHQLPGSEKVL